MNKTDNKKSFPKKMSKKYPILIGVGILGIMIAHFVLQMNFIQTEQFRAVEVAVQTENTEVEKLPVKVEKTVPQVINIVPEVYEVQTVKVITIPEKVKPTPRREVENVPAVKTPPKKKVVRKTKKETTEEDERMRRAEKILTGF